MTQTLTTEQLQGIYEAAVHVEATLNDPDAELELYCKLDEIGGVEATIRKLIDMVRAANREAQPVVWGSPKTVGQLIGQLQTLDPAMETTALLRMPADILDGNAVKQVPISISFERLEGHWLAPYKGDGRKVLAFWAKADHREETDRGELFTAPPAVQKDVEAVVGLLESGEWAEHCTNTELGQRLESAVTALMTNAPPAPAVPGYISTRQAIANMENHELCGSINVAYKHGWNDFRAAMLSQPVSQGGKLDSLNIRAVSALREAVRNQWLKSNEFAEKVYWHNMHSIANEIIEAMAAAPEGGNDA